MTSSSSRSPVYALIAAMTFPLVSHGAAQLIVGPTPIVDGEAGAAGDITS